MNHFKHLLKRFYALPVLLTGFLLLAGSEVLQADPLRDDSVSSVDLSALPSTFIFQPDTTLRVSEGEVRAGLLYDAVNQKIIWQKNMNGSYPIASLTKMMVALLTVEDVRAGKYTWEDNLRWIRQISTGRRRHRKIVSSEVNYTLRDVFKAAMIASNNECAEQMARYIGRGDLKATIDRMNMRAHELGMLSTYYGNPTGLPASRGSMDNSSSPADQLTLALELLKYGEVVEIASMGYASIDNGKASSVIRNHNHLTIDYSGEVDGLKTGYTRRAGFCLVASAAKCEHRLISVVLGCRGPQIRNQVVRDMFNDYYASIALDRLGSSYSAPLNASMDGESGNAGRGDFVNVSEKVRTTHLVKRGETLGLIAAKYKCTTGQLRSWNKRNLRSGKLMSGQRLAVYTTVTHKVFIRKPANGSEEEDDQPILSEAEKNVLDEPAVGTAGSPQATAVAPATTVCLPEDHFIYHTVAKGDTLFSIARKYPNISVEQLKSLNNISDIKSLKPGMKLKVPVQG